MCQKEYDGGSFLTYPMRDGKPYVLSAAANPFGNNSYRQHEKLHPTPKQEQEAFFQTWLFFGLIHEVLGQLCSRDDFVRDSEDGTSKLITTSKLLGIIDVWVEQVHSGELKPSYDHIAQCLNLVFATLRGAGPAFDSIIMFSLASIAELLEVRRFRQMKSVFDNSSEAASQL